MAYLNKEFVANQVLKAEELNGIVSYINGLDNQALQDQIDKHQATLNEWKDRLDKAEKDVNQLAQNLSDAALESLKKELGDAKNKYADALKKIEDAKALIEDGKKIITDTQHEIEEAQKKIDEAKDILADLAGSEGSAGQNILEALGRVETFAEWYNTNEETIANISVILDAVEATKQDVVNFIDTNGETITTLTTALKGKDGLIISVAKLVDTVNNNETTVTSELNALKALIDQNARNINTNTGKIDDVGIRIDGIEDSIRLHAKSILTVEGKVANVEVGLQGVQGEITAKGTAIDTLKKEVGEFSGRISAAEGNASLAIFTANTATANVVQYKETINTRLNTYDKSLADVQTEVGKVSEIQESWKNAGLDPEMIQRVATYDDPSLMIESSTIDILKNKIGLVTTKANGTNVINSAAIVAAINNDDKSSITLKADQIDIIGDTLINELKTVDLSIGGGSSLFHKDGSGQVANGAITWDAKGNIQGININAPMYITTIGFKSPESFSVKYGSVFYASENIILSCTNNASNNTIYCYIDGTSSYKSCSITGSVVKSVNCCSCSHVTVNNTTYFAITTSTGYVILELKKGVLTTTFKSVATIADNYTYKSVHMFYIGGYYCLLTSHKTSSTLYTGESVCYRSQNGTSWSNANISSTISSYFVDYCFNTTVSGTNYIVGSVANRMLMYTTDGVNWYQFGGNTNIQQTGYHNYLVDTNDGLFCISTGGGTGIYVYVIYKSLESLYIPNAYTTINGLSALNIAISNQYQRPFFKIDNYTVIPCYFYSGSQWYNYILYSTGKTFKGLQISNSASSNYYLNNYYYNNSNSNYCLIWSNGSNASFYKAEYSPSKTDIIKLIQDLAG